MNKNLQYALLLASLFLVLSACTPVSRAAGFPPPTVAPTTQVSQSPVSVNEAQVQSIEVQAEHSNFSQFNAVVRGNLNDACTKLGDISTTYSANTFRIKLETISATDHGCVQVITPFQQVIPLDTSGLAPGTYTVVANGVSTVFTIPGEPTTVPSSLQVVVRASDGSLQVVNLSQPLNPTARPAFYAFLPAGGAAAGNAYVLDSYQNKAFVTDGKAFKDLPFVQSPAAFGMAVWPGDAATPPRLAWATHNIGGDASSTIKISNPDGSQFDTLLTQDAVIPPVQLTAQFFSADGRWLYYSKEPMGLGGYILFGGASNLYKINISTRIVTEVIPQGTAESPQACLDAFSSDFRYVADHCVKNAITIRDLGSGKVSTISPPGDVANFKFLGSARFSPDGSRVAFALAKGDQQAEQGWVAVSNSLSGDSKVILTSQPGSYYTVAGWLDDQTLLVQATYPLECSPLCRSELWTVGADGSGAQKVADGSFLAAIPNDAIVQLPAGPTATPAAAACTNAAEYVSDDGQDGTTHAPNTAFTKTWTIKNIGTCTWDNRYLIYQVSGELMTQQPGYWLVSPEKSVAPGQTVDVQIGMTSPPKNGTYRADWGLKDADGITIPIKGGTAENSFFVELSVSDGTETGKVTASAIDMSLEQGSGEACSADATYFVHAYISTDGPATIPYEIGSSAGQISAGYFEDANGKSDYITGELVFDKAETRQINLRFVGPYPYPSDITVMLRTAGGDWYNFKLLCP